MWPSCSTAERKVTYQNIIRAEVKIREGLPTFGSEYFVCVFAVYRDWTISLRILSYDRSTVPSTVRSPQNAIWCVPFQFPVFYLFLKGHPVAVYIFFLVFPSLLSFNNVFYQAVPTQYVNNPVTLPSFLVYVGHPSPSWFYVILLHFRAIGATDLRPSFPNTTFQNLIHINLMCGWPCIVIQCG